jgi:hypothetical protein
MTELELALLELGRELDVPPAPLLGARVRARIERRSRRRVAVAIAFAVAVVAVGVAFAVPQARSAILRFFHLGAATVERVETLPPAGERPLVAGLGPARTRTAAERVAGFPMVLPKFEHGEPARYFARPGAIATSFRDHGKVVLLVELNGEQAGIAKKFVAGRTLVEPAEVSGVYFGLWISGGDHVVRWSTPEGGGSATTRLAGNVLLWQAHSRTYRIEGDLSREAALDLAGRITP